MDYISLTEYAAMHGLEHSSVRQKAARGGYQTARKIGRNWVIDKDEPHIDNRIKGGQYINWRKK